jgi:hypothetical protein
MHRRLVLAGIGTLAVPSFACTVGSRVAEYTKAELVAKSKTIVLGKATSSKAALGAEEFTFQTLEVLRGKASPTFSLVLEAAPETYLETDFSAHTDPEFWGGSYGRLPWTPGSCAPKYAFELGAEYLLFLDLLGNGASAERIRTRSNKWYRYVRAQVKSAA